MCACVSVVQLCVLADSAGTQAMVFCEPCADLVHVGRWSGFHKLARLYSDVSCAPLINAPASARVS